MTVYDKSGQRLFFVRENATYGQPYDPASDANIVAFGTTTTLGDTPIPANYVHWRRLDFIPDAADIILPQIAKIKQYDIGDFKHAGAVVSGNIEPIEFSLEMDAQHMEFLAFAIGSPVFNSHKQKISQTITCVAKSAMSNGDYFLMDMINSADDVEHHLFWFDIDAGGSAPTSPAGIADADRHEVALDGAADTATGTADALEAILEALDEITTANNEAGVITVVPTNNGAVVPARDGVATTGFTFAVATQGSTAFDITESTDTTLPSFTLHVEAQNATSAEDIVWDLYGCVVESVEVSNSYGDKVAKYTVTIKCPYALENSNGKATLPPSKKITAPFVALECLQESTNNCLLQAGTTSTVNSTDDHTPEQLDKVVLTIKNNVAFKTDLAHKHAVLACAGKRDVSLNLVGNTGEKELYTYFLEATKVSSGDWIPASASERLNTKFKMQKDATYDYILISVYNWLIKEHNFTLVSVDDAVKNVDILLEDADGNSSGIMIDDCDFIGYTDPVIMTYNTT